MVTRIFILTFLMINSFFAFSQSDKQGQRDFKESDDIDVHKVKEAYYWPAKRIYVFIVEHRYYKGPTLAEPIDTKASKSFYVLSLTKRGRVDTLNYSPEWIGAKPDMWKMRRAKYIEYGYEKGKGNYWQIGKHQYFDPQMPSHYEFFGAYEGDAGDIICIVGETVASWSWGWFYHEYQEPYRLWLDTEMNYWLQNKEGFYAYHTKDYQSAIEWFQKSLEINPEFRHANFNMACTMCIAGYPFEEGKMYLERLLDHPEFRSTYLLKIQEDDDLSAWRDRVDFILWFAKYKHSAD